MFTVPCDGHHWVHGRRAIHYLRAGSNTLPKEASPMNASTARALFVGLLVAVWVWLSGQARLRVEVWPGIVAALIAGGMAVGIILVARVPFLGFVAGAFAGAGVAWGLRVNTFQEGIQVGIALVVGALVGFLAERLAGAVAA